MGLFDFITRLFVLLGYIAVVVNTVRVLRTKPMWHRKMALLVILPPALYWILFYAHLEFAHVWDDDSAGMATLAAWSRIGHTLTFGAFLAQQFLITAAARDQLATLEQVVLDILETHDNA